VIVAKDFPEIARRSDPSVAPLSLGQEGLWLFQQCYPDNVSLNLFRVLRAAKPLIHDVLEQTVTELARRHEILRTNYRIIDGRPMQAIRPPEPMSVGLFDFSHLPPSERRTELAQWLRIRSSQSFDLANAELLRTDLVRLGESEDIVLFYLHHISCDGWSFGVLLREVRSIYDAFVEKKPHALPELSLQYGDYAAWQRRGLHADNIAKQLSFWRERLANAPETTSLPLDRPRQRGRSRRGAQSSVALESSLVEDLRLLCQREHATLFMVLIATLAALFQRYSGATDIVIGTPVANRSRPEFEPLIGLFMNVVACRFDLAGDPAFREFLANARAVVIDAFNNQDVAFETVVSELGARRQGQQLPLFQPMFVMQPPRAASVFTELGADAAELAPRGSKFDFTLYLSENEFGEVSGFIEYDTNVFEQSAIDNVFHHYTALLKAVAADPSGRISMLRMLDDAERRQELFGWNDTTTPCPEGCVHDLFADQARRTPNAVALRYAGEEIDYSSLDRRANRLAWRLRGLGIGPDSIVGLFMRRSAAQIIAMLAIFKAGGAYLPLDPDYPHDRLTYMLSDAQPQLVLTNDTSVGGLPPVRGAVLNIDSDGTTIDNEPTTSPTGTTSGENLAYILYTFGSTEQPKGVMGTHRAIANRVYWDVPGSKSDEVYIYKTSLGFIDALWEILMPLVRGQTMIVAPEAAATDPSQLVDLLAGEKATRVALAPSLLASILMTPKDLAQRLRNVTHWAVRGETLTLSLAALFAERLPEAHLFNIYGATEFWDATCYSARDTAGHPNVPIGLPIANMRVLVLDADFEPVPVGVTGELYVGGAGLARGYLGGPSLTAERFVPDPGRDGDRLYRTGDIARRRSDGVLEFVGRRDHQVKLRGHGVELSEVELALEDCPGVQQAIVQVREDLPTGHPGLVVYLVASTEGLTELSVRKFLVDRLASHARPLQFVFIHRLPLTPSGKVDRSQLPPPRQRKESHRAHVRPRSNLEKELEGIWREVLGIDLISIDDNFFEIGGNSLTLVEIQNLILQRMRRDVPIVTLIRYPSIRALGSYRSLASSTVGESQGDGLDISRKRGQMRKAAIVHRSAKRARHAP
jgi:amino acid adenylation domain-containing protein